MAQLLQLHMSAMVREFVMVLLYHAAMAFALSWIISTILGISFARPFALNDFTPLVGCFIAGSSVARVAIAQAQQHTATNFDSASPLSKDKATQPRGPITEASTSEVPSMYPNTPIVRCQCVLEGPRNADEERRCLESLDAWDP